MARFIYINPTGYPIEQLPREWHGISPFTEAQPYEPADTQWTGNNGSATVSWEM